uniref:Uncharacterized protein n=1 Tax=Arundo donax TaxID=35708 RepID=A0A0A9F281_ARUDO
MCFFRLSTELLLCNYDSSIVIAVQ